METMNNKLEIECNGRLTDETSIGLPKLAEMKLPRLPKE